MAVATSGSSGILGESRNNVIVLAAQTLIIASPTIVTCDASVVGAVLSQEQNGVERPIAFASRRPPQSSATPWVSAKPLLLWASERWHLYLYGRHFTHQALATLLSASGSSHKPLRLHRWGERLRQYDYGLKYTPGRDNVVTDRLSRSINAPTLIASPGSDDTEPELILMLHAPLQTTVLLEEPQQELERDPMLTTLRTYIRSGWPARVPEELAPFARELKNPSTGRSTEGGEMTAATWKWYEAMDKDLGSSHSITPVAIGSSSAPGGRVLSFPSEERAGQMSSTSCSSCGSTAASTTTTCTCTASTSTTCTASTSTTYTSNASTFTAPEAPSTSPALKRAKKEPVWLLAIKELERMEEARDVRGVEWERALTEREDRWDREDRRDREMREMREKEDRRDRESISRCTVARILLFIRMRFRSIVIIIIIIIGSKVQQVIGLHTQVV
ncbi:hypothetical protein SKAU_G00156500 [Synaphobranchus kaupii]|uniref:Reverse transcriptase RNase H-like domain-containing protein n=1 Tax=Synaphobranchus kaupii TaxID=118154 RepID=A0A9Q1FHP2_SYNKA|nr:hypothetical protein SKAU_G00156500 [Synaphobranchus kaupii]